MSIDWILLALRLLAVAVLYVFLLVVLYLIWRDLRAAAQGDSEYDTALLPADESLGRLSLVSVGETLLGAGQTFALKTHTTLGRAADNHVVLSDTYVSSYHARLDCRDGEWWLTDLNSRNGTRLNDVAITKPVPLADGDIIGLGQVELRLAIGDRSPAPISDPIPDS
jgi:hypothetical protein